MFPRGLLLAGLLVSKCVVAQDSSPPRLNDGWETARPADVGLDPQALAAMTEALRAGEFGNIHAVLVERRGRLVYEEYFAGPDASRGRDLGEVIFGVDTAHDLRSVTKSVTSALVGIAVARGDLTGVDTPLTELLPEYRALLTGAKSDITLRHMLTMSSGLTWDESLSYSDPMNYERRMIEAEDPIGFVLAQPLIEDPGSRWNYSGGDTQVLAAVLEAATTTPLLEYARMVLFEPLGVYEVDWPGYMAGTPSAASGLRLLPRDLAKIGSLFLNSGRWQDTSILPEAWIESSISSHIQNTSPSPPDFVLFEGYGYQWWVNTFATSLGQLDVATAVGNGGQRIILIPALDMVVTVLAGFYDDPQHFWTPERLLFQRILPAVTDHARE